MNKNLIDSDEYPATTLIHSRCVNMLASLWHADDTKHATGTATTGSSEAIQLAGLAMKKIWQEKMRKAGKDEYRPVSFGWLRSLRAATQRAPPARG